MEGVATILGHLEFDLNILDMWLRRLLEDANGQGCMRYSLYPLGLYA